jgi:hypothetical protein
LQKSLPCAIALATLCGATQTHIIDNQVERANVQGGLAPWWQQVVSFNFLFAISCGSGKRIAIRLWLVTFTFLSLLRSGTGLDVIKCHHYAKPPDVVRHLTNNLKIIKNQLK